MLMVATSIAPSPIHGIGLFAGSDIPAGTVVWRHHPAAELVFDTFAPELSSFSREQFEKYAYKANHDGKYYLCLDDARFINHSSTPNLGVRLEAGIEENFALRPIKAGEEITINYNELEDAA